MNRKDKRELAKKIKKQNKKIKNDPLFPLMEAVIKGGRSEFKDVEALRKMALATEPCPEPVVVNFLDFNVEVFQRISSESVRPTVFYIQEEDGSISLVRHQNRDLTRIYFKLREATHKDLSALGWDRQTDIEFIETLKCMNYSIESLGGYFQDVVHVVSSKIPKQKRVDEFHQKILNHWTAEYIQFRKLVLMET